MKHLRNKIMLVLVVFSICVLLLNMLVVTGAFNHGFKRYIDNQRIEQMQELADSLSSVYADESDWQWLQQRPKHWHFWLRTGKTKKAYEKRRFKNKPHKFSNEPEYLSSLEKKYKPEWLKKEKSERFSQENFKRTSLHRKERLVKLTFLYDSQQVAIFGPHLRDEKKLKFVPVQHQGQTVAYIAYFTAQKMFSDIENVFLKQQRMIFFLSMLLAVGLSVLLAYFLAKRFLKPVAAIRNGVQKMVQGDYEQQVQIAGQDELASLGKDVNLLAATLDKQNKIQQRWLADIAHELRTPLAVLKAQLEAIEDGVRNFDKDELQLLIKESNYLQKLVEDLRELSLSEPGSFAYRWEKINIVAFLKESQVIWSSHLQQSFIDLKTHIETDSCFIQADAQRLQQLFHNLMQNSCRYTQASQDEPGKVRVAVKQTAKQLNIVWEDTGPGVPADKLEYLFDRLYRADESRNRQAGGSGLGLAICKNIVEAHGGVIEAQQSELGGLKIIISFEI